jgi:transposase
MRIDYPAVIRETVQELAQHERTLRGRRKQHRVQLLRLLKEGRVPSLAQAAPLVGYSVPQARRWWATYQAHGLAALTASGTRPARPSKVDAEAWAGLEAELRAGRIARLEDARTYLDKRWHVRYASLNGVSQLFRRHGVKWKTGRRRHQLADAAQQEAFPPGVRRGSGRPGRHARARAG